ncbi:MAG TPA: hypothetical protein VJ440_11335 [Candidatus Brocadiaceae bacterium]|nr:hypothetical protein [Candidatus Brocadiaceae bacterium]
MSQLPLATGNLHAVVHCHLPSNAVGNSHRRQETAPTRARVNVCHYQLGLIAENGQFSGF